MYYTQGRNDVGAMGGTISQAPDHYGGAKCLPGATKNPNNFTSTFFSTVHLLPKDLRFEHTGAKLASSPGRIFTKCNLIRWIRGFQPITVRDNVPDHWWSLPSHAHLATSYLCEAAAAIWEGLSPCGWLVCSWIGTSYPVPPNFTHWAALKLCIALQNFYKFLVKLENLCTCASPEVTHSFKQTPTLTLHI